MKKSKLILNLSTLSQQELRHFGEFVDSPFFNKNEEIKLFFNYLMQNPKRWGRLTKAEVFTELFPDKAYREHTMNNLMFNLMELFKQYLGQVVYASRPEKIFHIAEGMHRNKLWKLLKSYLGKYFKQINKQTIRGLKYYRQTNICYEYQELVDADYEENQEGEAMQQAALNAEICFAIEKLKQSCDLLNRMIVYNHSYDLGMVDELLSYINKRWDYFGSIVLISIYKQVFLSLRNPHEVTHFYKLIELVAENRGKCELSDLKKMYEYSINLGIELLNKRGGEFVEPLFQVYLMLIEDGLHLEQGEITHMNYKNIVSIAIKSGDYEWARKFMYEHQGKLNVKFRKDTFEFNLAYLYYSQQNYQEALLLLSRIRFNNIFYQINTKILQIKIFFELEEYDVLLSFLENFRLFLIRNKELTKERLKLTQNYVFYTRKVIRLLSSKERIYKRDYHKKMQAFEAKLKQSNIALLNKDWLLKIIEIELEQATAR